jgi:hypothetical protein
MPRAASSPWIRRYPHEAFSLARRRTRTRIERIGRGRPRRLGAQEDRAVSVVEGRLADPASQDQQVVPEHEDLDVHLPDPHRQEA